MIEFSPRSVFSPREWFWVKNILSAKLLGGSLYTGIVIWAIEAGGGFTSPMHVVILVAYPLSPSTVYSNALGLGCHVLGLLSIVYLNRQSLTEWLSEVNGGDD
jgi:hypothetical protein